MTSRRDFIRTLTGAAALAGFGGIPLDVLARHELIKLTVLHTNDVHSRIDPFPENDPKYPGMAGVERRASLIRSIRAREKNVLLLDAGDIFQGTPYFNMYGGELELKLMTDMGYDASTIGNHEFDNGIDGLVKQLPNARFPLLNCNYNLADSALNDKVLPYKVFENGGITTGIFGVGIELAGLVDPHLYGNIRYEDPLEKAKHMAHFLRNEKKCDLVICLSHLGYKYNSNKISDEVLAQKTSNIDLIVGGHTHTFLDKPVSFRNAANTETLVAQVGWAGIRLGRVDYYFDIRTRRKMATGTTVKINSKTIAI
ncbi:MAG: metallophosphatase [Bacteroidia bacterium]|nr:metallophosphatase [Bacteroidia bacterium]